MLSTLSVNTLFANLYVKSLNFNFTPICDNFTKWRDPKEFPQKFLWFSRLFFIKKVNCFRSNGKSKNYLSKYTCDTWEKCN